MYRQKSLKVFQKSGNSRNKKLLSNRWIYANTYTFFSSSFWSLAFLLYLSPTLLYPWFHAVSYIKNFLYVVWTYNSTELQVLCIQ